MRGFKKKEKHGNFLFIFDSVAVASSSNLMSQKSTKKNANKIWTIRKTKSRKNLIARLFLVCVSSCRLVFLFSCLLHQFHHLVSHFMFEAFPRLAGAFLRLLLRVTCRKTTSLVRYHKMNNFLGIYWIPKIFISQKKRKLRARDELQHKNKQQKLSKSNKQSLKNFLVCEIFTNCRRWFWSLYMHEASFVRFCDKWNVI